MHKKKKVMNVHYRFSSFFIKCYNFYFPSLDSDSETKGLSLTGLEPGTETGFE